MDSNIINRASVMAEFDADFIDKWFSLNAKSVKHHIDTLYYTVSVKGDCLDTSDAGMIALLSEMDFLKQRKKAVYSDEIDFFGLNVEATGFSTYEYHLSFPEVYDVFVASYLPNLQTPRICVQIRSRSLVLDGVYKAIEQSYEKVVEILNEYGLEVDEVKENRVDYAYHTNLIQNPMKYFSDAMLRRSLKSKMRKYMKIGAIGEDMTLETISLGNRKSNNVFFRCYDKTKEVIDKGYKSFFFERWRDLKLISEFDYFVYNIAYETHAYRTGILLGRIAWYQRYGTNEEIQAKLRSLVKSCYTDSDNAEHIEKELHGLLPEVTRIMNVEFQTKRKFYHSFEAQIKDIDVSFSCDDKLNRLFKVVYLRSAILDYLTSSQCVAFLKDRRAKLNKEVYLDWWRRIRACKIDEDETEEKELLRVHERFVNREKAVRRVLNSLASFNIIDDGDGSDKTFMEDISDTLAYLNDNDIIEFRRADGKAAEINPKLYDGIRMRKLRQNRALLVKSKEKVEELREQHKKIIDEDNSSE